MKRHSMMLFIMFVSTILSISGLLPNASFSASLEGGGVYSLGKKFPSKILLKEEITGISLRVHWNDMESQEGIIDWTYLDENIQKAITYGKKIMIRVTAGKYTPEWVYDKGAEKLVFTEDGMISAMPLPWDEVYLTEWANFVKALGQRYSHLEQIAMVHMTGPCKKAEMYLPEKSNQQLWLQAGYTREKVVNAWIKVIDAYAEAFPETPLVLDIAHPLYFGEGQELLYEIINYGYLRLGNRLCIQGNWLAAKTKENFSLYQLIKYTSMYINVGFQMSCGASNIERFGGTLRGAIDKGLAAGASYLEVYGVDIKNPDYEEDIKYADFYLKLNEKISYQPVLSPDNYGIQSLNTSMVNIIF